MGLNLDKIRAALSMYPSCHGSLIESQGNDAHAYCAMGALARYVGVSNEKLKQYNPGGEQLFNDIKDKLKKNFGIETYGQFSRLMETNDSIEGTKPTDRIKRARAVKRTAEAMSPDEVNDMLESASQMQD